MTEKKFSKIRLPDKKFSTAFLIIAGDHPRARDARREIGPHLILQQRSCTPAHAHGGTGRGRRSGGGRGRGRGGLQGRGDGSPCVPDRAGNRCQSGRQAEDRRSDPAGESRVRSSFVWDSLSLLSLCVYIYVSDYFFYPYYFFLFFIVTLWLRISINRIIIYRSDMSSSDRRNSSDRHSEDGASISLFLNPVFVLQINGVELTTRAQTEELFAGCGTKVTLLVSRTQYYVSSCCLFFLTVFLFFLLFL